MFKKSECTGRPGARPWAVAAIGAAALTALPLVAHAAKPPIVVGVTGWLGSIPGKAVANGAQLAAEQINAKGGVDGRMIKLVIEDNHNSTTDAIRSFQRMTKQDHAVAIVGDFTSEVGLALEPWSARLHEPFLITGAASNKLTAYVHANYKAHKYIFEPNLNSYYLAQNICDAAKDVLVGDLHMKSAVVMSENAAWTLPLDAAYKQCLPKAGLTVKKEIRFAPDTSDFTPIYNKIEAMHPDAIITGWAHAGVKPTVQWAEEKVPLAVAGISSEATSTTFWKSTNGATQGIMTIAPAAEGIEITPKTQPFMNAYKKKFGISPAYTGFTTYDTIYLLAAAIERAKSTKPDALVSAIEKTDMVGTEGRIQFYGKDARFAHGMMYGPGHVQWIDIQWQDGKQKCIWPKKLANAQPKFPPFVKLPK